MSHHPSEEGFNDWEVHSEVSDRVPRAKKKGEIPCRNPKEHGMLFLGEEDAEEEERVLGAASGDSRGACSND